MDLAAIPWRATRYDGLSVHFYTSNRDTHRVVALIRMQPGCGYPRHRHRGREDVLVLRGGYRDELGTHGRGEFAVYADGTTHTPVAVDESEDDCVLLVVAHEGIKLV
ncbi:MAG: cupin domain-containing protein [Planctomycetes bacterium]|nr:cupin domain-containing protein [Planctomycetota bacterium]